MTRTETDHFCRRRGGGRRPFLSRLLFLSSSDRSTVEFSSRCQDYTLILTRDNGAQFDEDVARYIAAAKNAQRRDAREP
ncbi:hypothetical protein ACWDUN_27660 [Mycobacterium sp. NPDC003323]